MKRLLLAAGIAAVGLIPTLQMLLKGEINGRMNDVLITGPKWVRENRGLLDSDTFVVKAFLDHVALHLRPSYLFIHGDPNPRHSSQLVGQLSPIDTLALALALGVLLTLVVRWLRNGQLGASGTAPPIRWFSGIALSAIVCGFFGVVPSALTWDSMPHALRSIGTWPFVSLFTGAILALGWSYKRWVPPGVALVAAGYSAYFLPAYFQAFDHTDRWTYIRDMSDDIFKARYGQQRKSVAQVVSERLDFGDEVIMYYLMHDGKMTCPQAAEALRSMRRK
jgi:hypothetical protein